MAEKRAQQASRTMAEALQQAKEIHDDQMTVIRSSEQEARSKSQHFQTRYSVLPCLL